MNNQWEDQGQGGMTSEGRYTNEGRKRVEKNKRDVLMREERRLSTP
jgi:hypothetical protein